MKLNFYSLAFITAIALSAGSAIAAKGNAAKKTEASMLKACQKEYSTELKGKTFNEVAEWVESEEKGANAEAFKKTKCYALHEKWESASGHNEDGEEHEHK